ncbi:MAG: FAD-dependent oxidoreductase, partial [Longimicrobiales bacterium]
MEMDARALPHDGRLDADLCIIGGGAAGITLAHELAGRDIDVLLLESGGTGPNPDCQELNEGRVVGDDYAGLRATRHRALGGTIRLWNTPVLGEPGAKYAPLDAADFRDRTLDRIGGWPFDHAHLEPFYRRVQQLCGLGAFAYDAEHWPDRATRPLPMDGHRITTRIYQFGGAHVFTDRNVATLHNADNVRVCTHATVSGLEVQNGRVTAARVLDPRGRPARVVAATFVLAAGAIENARLLLLSLDPATPARAHGWIGRCFMEHPRDHALTLIPRSPTLFRDAAFYDLHAAADGTMVAGRFALTERTLEEDGIPNASVTLLPRRRRRSRVSRLRERFGGHRAPQRAGYGWSTLDDPAALFDAFQLIVNVEQRPHPENRVLLGARRDRLGLPEPELHWRWRDG